MWEQNAVSEQLTAYRGEPEKFNVDFYCSESRRQRNASVKRIQISITFLYPEEWLLKGYGVCRSSWWKSSWYKDVLLWHTFIMIYETCRHLQHLSIGDLLLAWFHQLCRLWLHELTMDFWKQLGRSPVTLKLHSLPDICICCSCSKPSAICRAYSGICFNQSLWSVSRCPAREYGLQRFQGKIVPAGRRHHPSSSIHGRSKIAF